MKRSKRERVVVGREGREEGEGRKERKGGKRSAAATISSCTFASFVVVDRQRP